MFDLFLSYFVLYFVYLYEYVFCILYSVLWCFDIWVYFFCQDIIKYTVPCTYMQMYTNSAAIWTSLKRMVRYRGNWCTPRGIQWWARFIPMNSRGKYFPRRNLPWWPVPVQTIQHFPRCLLYSAELFTSSVVFESACMITQGSILPCGHADDAGHAVFDFFPM